VAEEKPTRHAASSPAGGGGRAVRGSTSRPSSRSMPGRCAQLDRGGRRWEARRSPARRRGPARRPHRRRWPRRTHLCGRERRAFAERPGGTTPMQRRRAAVRRASTRRADRIESAVNRGGVIAGSTPCQLTTSCVSLRTAEVDGSAGRGGAASISRIKISTLARDVGVA